MITDQKWSTTNLNWVELGCDNKLVYIYIANQDSLAEYWYEWLNNLMY